MKNKAGLILAILLPLQYIGIKILAEFPVFVETWYSTGLYPYISRIMRFSLGIIPISFGDILYAIFIVAIIRWIAIRINTRFRNPKKWIIQLLAIFSIIYGCFHLFWGLNYYRLPLHKTLKIKNDYNTEELVILTETLIKRSNEVHQQLVENDSMKVPYNFKKAELLKGTIDGFDYLKGEYPKLTYNGKSLKRSLYSVPLTYMGFNGYLNPLTNEAQVNTHIVLYKIPTTASHEIGHQLGFAKENEANFIACLATINHPNPYYRYSGLTFALRYCLNEVFARDKALGDALYKKINPGILANYKEVRDFWLLHQNPIEPLFQVSYNTFLKANNQQEGMKSYSYVVALLVNYYDDVENAF